MFDSLQNFQQTPIDVKKLCFIHAIDVFELRAAYIAYKQLQIEV